MPIATPPVDLEKFAGLAKPLIESGRYPNAAAVLAAAMDALSRQIEEEAKEAWLIAAVEEGEASGVAQGDVIGRIFEKAGWPESLRR